MRLRNVFMTAIACSVFVIAEGSKGNQGTDGAAGSGGMEGDTMKVSGTIQEISPTDRMLIVESDTGSDTIYFNEQTQMPLPEQLQQGTQVTVKYTMSYGRKEAVMISMGGNGANGTKEKDSESGAAGGSNGSQGQMSVTGTVQELNLSDSMIVLQSDTGTDTLYFDEDTELDMSEIQQGTQVTAQYEKKDNRKVVKSISQSSNGNGQKSEEDTMQEY